ncbi:hypothetical protein ACQ4LE_003130 [Meloidogyne hapla]
MAPPKRKSFYKDEYAREFNGIKKGKTDEYAHCVPCQFDICLTASKILSIPVSNSCVERIFSLCSAQWTDTRNLLNVDTVKCLAQLKVNIDLSCPQMYDLLISKPKLLKQIICGDKYNI